MAGIRWRVHGSVVNSAYKQVEQLREEAYVPFNIDFSTQDGTSKVITGPNMAGKLSQMRGFG